MHSRRARCGEGGGEQTNLDDSYVTKVSCQYVQTILPLVEIRLLFESHERSVSVVLHAVPCSSVGQEGGQRYLGVALGSVLGEASGHIHNRTAS
jgi:hypothetical protein